TSWRQCPGRARKITVPGTELRLPGFLFRLFSVDICHHRTALRQGKRPADRRARSFASALDRCPVRRGGHSLIGEDTVSSERTLFHRRGQGPIGEGYIGAVRPCQENTARHVFMIAASTRSAGSIPAPTGM